MSKEAKFTTAYFSKVKPRASKDSPAAREVTSAPKGSLILLSRQWVLMVTKSSEIHISPSKLGAVLLLWSARYLTPLGSYYLPPENSPSPLETSLQQTSLLPNCSKTLGRNCC